MRSSDHQADDESSGSQNSLIRSGLQESFESHESVVNL